MVLLVLSVIVRFVNLAASVIDLKMVGYGWSSGIVVNWLAAMAILYACCRCRFLLYAVVVSMCFISIDRRSELKSANAALTVTARSCLVSSTISTIIESLLLL